MIVYNQTQYLAYAGTADGHITVGDASNLAPGVVGTLSDSDTNPVSVRIETVDYGTGQLRVTVNGFYVSMEKYGPGSKLFVPRQNARSDYLPATGGTDSGNGVTVKCVMRYWDGIKFGQLVQFEDAQETVNVNGEELRVVYPTYSGAHNSVPQPLTIGIIESRLDGGPEPFDDNTAINVRLLGPTGYYPFFTPDAGGSWQPQRGEPVYLHPTEDGTWVTRTEWSRAGLPGTPETYLDSEGLPVREIGHLFAMDTVDGQLKGRIMFNGFPTDFNMVRGLIAKDTASIATAATSASSEAAAANAATTALTTDFALHKKGGTAQNDINPNTTWVIDPATEIVHLQDWMFSEYNPNPQPVQLNWWEFGKRLIVTNTFGTRGILENPVFQVPMLLRVPAYFDGTRDLKVGTDYSPTMVSATAGRPAGLAGPAVIHNDNIVLPGGAAVGPWGHTTSEIVLPPNTTIELQAVWMPFSPPGFANFSSVVYEPVWLVMSSSASYYEPSVFFRGVPTAGATIMRHILTRGATFIANWQYSRVSAAVAATAQTTMSIQRNGVEVGYAEFQAGQSVGYCGGVGPPWNQDIVFSPGDVLSIVNANPADATLADISITLVGFAANIPFQPFG